MQLLIHACNPATISGLMMPQHDQRWLAWRKFTTAIAIRQLECNAPAMAGAGGFFFGISIRNARTVATSMTVITALVATAGAGSVAAAQIGPVPDRMLVAGMDENKSQRISERLRRRGTAGSKRPDQTRRGINCAARSASFHQ